MTKLKRVAPIHRFGAWLVVFLMLHMVPFPHPTQPIKSSLPDSYWQSLQIYEPPYGWFPPLYTAILGGVRQPALFFPAYETFLAIVAALFAFRFPHWFIGRE